MNFGKNFNGKRHLWFWVAFQEFLLRILIFIFFFKHLVKSLFIQIYKKHIRQLCDLHVLAKFMCMTVGGKKRFNEEQSVSNCYLPTGITFWEVWAAWLLPVAQQYDAGLFLLHHLPQSAVCCVWICFLTTGRCEAYTGKWRRHDIRELLVIAGFVKDITQLFSE